jgi:ATP-dependent DNA helicase RecQ
MTARRTCCWLSTTARIRPAPRRRHRPRHHRAAIPASACAPEEVARYDRLRAWRTSRAQADGVPIYLLLSNRQLAEIARSPPADLAGLGEGDGVRHCAAG